MNKSKGKIKKVNAIDNRKTDYGIPVFSFKSALVLILFATLGSLAIPLILSFIGLPFKISVVLGSTFISPLGLVISRCYIESKEGYGKTFRKLYFAFAAAFALISVFWTFFNNYI